ncbi:Acyl carrier protein [Pseudomonas amygdali pv. dendropanacis]|uniref:Acyl carrier protein n=1 Tax=Pseudomonas amygdali pv. dendropanacis TaxID=235272 RepID=A0A0P9R4V5_PSEA0|nr:acyl carrier protein [Pseudomonas amygdali]KPX23184.1 Acyl carrier protein [Pseudomonas amygdali pv. dendropanacis]KWS84167.1 hypothetical protein AL051_20100 [Pseudomonas amygdali pv. dendropanacis]
MSSIMETVKGMLAKQLDMAEKDIKPESTVLSLGADSLDSVEFIMLIENAFNIEIQEEEIKQFRTVQNIVDYVSKSKN